MEPQPAAARRTLARSDGSPPGLAQLVEQRAAERPGAIAVQAGEDRFTYAELDAASARVAAALRRMTGAGEEEAVGVCLPRSWQAVCAVVGCVRAGVACVPIPPSYPPQRIRELLRIAGAGLVIANGEAGALLSPAVRVLDCAALLAAPEPEREPAAPGGDRLAYVLFTSGSTGRPKGVELTHANLLALLESGSEMLPREDDGVLAVAPVEFDIASFELWGSLAAGARLVLAPPGRPDPRQLGRLIAARGVTTGLLAAGLFEQLVDAALPDLGSLRLVTSAGDLISAGAVAALRSAHPGVRVVNGYGPTETSILATGFEVGTLDGSPIPIGRPLPGYRLHVLGPDLRPVPEGEPGELWIGGPGVARGYRGDPERNRDRFRPDPFSEEPGARMYGSGDVVRLREDGELLFVGRNDDQVKIAGHRVEPGEVEQVLGSHPAVARAAVVAREDVARHKRLIGYASLRERDGATAEQLLDHLRQRLPAFMLPATIELLPQLPLTARGKVYRDALPAPRRIDRGRAAAGAGAGVAEAMGELLELERIGPDEDFFALGGDSLLALQLVGRLRDRFAAELEIGAVFEARTPRRLAAALERSGANSRPPLRCEPRTGPAPATFAQRRAWLFERMNPTSLAFQFAAIVDLEGELDEGALAAALGDLMQRHEIFRTALETHGGEPVQVVFDEVPVPLETIDLPGERGVEWARLVRSTVRRKIPLGRAPLVHWTLVRRGPRRWSLIDVEHHAAHDGWSFVIFLAELAELYSARVEGRQPRLDDVPVQPADFARWERELADGELQRRQLEYWRRTLNPDPPLLRLPTEGPRPARESFAGGSVRRPLPPQLAAAVRELAGEEGATAFMTGLAAFALLLGRCSGSDDVQVGSGLANRRDPAAEGLIGMTVGTVALRTSLAGDPTVRELLRRVRSVVLDAIANADVPFERVVEELAPQRDPTRSPLVQAMFSFDDAAARPARWSGLEARVVQTVPNGTAKADLNVIGVDHGGDDAFFIWEHSDLFSDATADRLAGQHLRLLEQFVADPDARISGLSLLDEDEEAELRAASTAAANFDREATVPELVARQARRATDAIAVVDGDRRLTYGELLDGARRVATALVEAGVEPGDAVAVLAGRSAAAILAQLGVLEAGAAYVPLDPAHPPSRIAGILADAGARVALVEPTLEATLPAGVGAIAIELALAAEPAAAPAARPGDLAYLMYTSGSTGEPKGVEVTHRNVVRLVDGPDFAELGAGTVMLHAASPAFDAATLEIWGPLANGGTVAVLGEQPSPDSIAAAIERHGVTTAWLTAGLFHELVDRRPDCLRGLRHLLAGGDVLSPRHVARALAALPADGLLSNGYGPTETTTFALTHRLRRGAEIGSSIPLGRPIQGTSCEVLDEHGRQLPDGVAGELWIGGDGVARGYRGDPELTSSRFEPDPHRPGQRRYRSGDRCRRRADGTIEFLGRIDRQVKVRGIRVEPLEVERVLRQHPAVGDVAVVAHGQGSGERTLAAYLVPVPGAKPEAAELRAHAAARLPAAMVPSAWVPVAALPLTANGKVDRERLPTPDSRHLARAPGGGRPQTAAERIVVESFERVLGVEGVGVEEDFFALGGHSLLAIALFTELDRRARRQLPLATIFEAPTPRALARRLESGAAVRWENLIALKPQGSRPPLFAVTAGDGNVVGFGALSRALPSAQPLYALQPSGLDGRSAIDRGIEAMAARCVEEIKLVQPDGPYLLAGRCNGATVAFEIAQRLRRAGDRVALLAALDSDPPPAALPRLAQGLEGDDLVEIALLRARDRGEPTPAAGSHGGPTDLRHWLRQEVGPGLSRYAAEGWHLRQDLQRLWPDPAGADAAKLASWAWEHGVGEHGLIRDLLLPVETPACRTADGRAWDWAMATAWQEAGRWPEDPLSAAGWREFQAHLLASRRSGVNRYLLAAARRPDLRDAFPDPEVSDAEDLLLWAWQHGVEEGLAPDLLPGGAAQMPVRLRARSAVRPLQERLLRALRELPPDALPGLDLDERRDRALDAAERRLRRALPRARRRREERLISAARAARERYRAEPWPGRVVLVTSAEFAEKPAYMAWPERAQGGVERRPLPLGHVEMLRAPGAGLLAECLDRCIREALEGR
ncbi:MAG TPA: amino acid adenylation domain-containing protein [Solirubrobacterales bacterium]|nr:amino acid adenylation domain-containing protein [Solirubrobacterales bacterium]